jgi:hypothetical protein
MPKVPAKPTRKILPARDRLLRAAMTCFARAGYYGTTSEGWPLRVAVVVSRLVLMRFDRGGCDTG